MKNKTEKINFNDKKLLLYSFLYTNYCYILILHNKSRKIFNKRLQNHNLHTNNKKGQTKKLEKSVRNTYLKILLVKDLNSSINTFCI